MQPNMNKNGQMWTNVGQNVDKIQTKCGHMWTNVDKCRQMCINCEQMWTKFKQNMDKCGNIWSMNWPIF